MCKVCGSMSKQRYLLVPLLLLMSSVLGAEINLQSSIYSADTGNKTAFVSSSRMDVEYNVLPFWQLRLGSKAETSDFAIDSFPQNRWVNSYLAMSYASDVLKAEAGYRNLLFGAAQDLQLYPNWNPGMDFRRNAQHQLMLRLEGDYNGLKLNAYAATKHLYANPIEYIYDFVTDTNTPNVLASRSLDELYAGAEIGYRLHPVIMLGGGYEHKQSNFPDSDVYDSAAYYLYSQAEYMLYPGSRISGSINWKHNSGDAVRDETRNQYISSVRYQQSLGFGLNGFVSFINNSCSDDKLAQLWQVSNYIRSHIQYHFAFDPAGASYVMAGAVIIPEKESETLFAESSMRLIGNVYGNAGYSHRKDIASNYQIKLSYFLNQFSECYLQSSFKDPASNADLQSYYGLGVSIRL